MKDGLESNEWQGVPLARVYGSPGRNWGSGSPPWRRWAWQAVFGLVLFAAVLGVFSLEREGLAGRLQAGLRHYLAEESSDWSPRVVEAWSSGLWLDSFERWDYAQGSAGGGAGDRIEPAATRLRPLSVPVAGRVVRYYGLEPSPEAGSGQVLHGGTDIAAPPLAPVQAAQDGTVSRVGSDSRLGRYVQLDHGAGVTTVYGLLGETLVKPGEAVKRGREIGRLGPRASGEEPVLHFEVRYQGQPVDPLEWLGSELKGRI